MIFENYPELTAKASGSSPHLLAGFFL
jgi:hypothetical protein